MKKRAFIIEDEPAGYNNLKNMLEIYCEDMEVIGHASTIEEARLLLAQPGLQPDVAFLDINLPDGLVFQLLDSMKDINFQLIFVTAYNKYALRACEYSLMGYLTKPLDPDKLVRAVKNLERNKLVDQGEKLEVFKSHYFDQPNAFRKMIFPTSEGEHFVNIADIIYLEASDNCTFFHLEGGDRFLVTKTIKTYEELLTPFNFYRIHKGHIVNLNYIARYINGEGGSVILTTGKDLSVSKRRKKGFRQHLEMSRSRSVIHN